MTNDSIKVKSTVVLVRPLLHKMFFFYIFFKTLFALTFFNMSRKLIPFFNSMVKERPRFTIFYTGDNKI